MTNRRGGSGDNAPQSLRANPAGAPAVAARSPPGTRTLGTATVAAPPQIHPTLEAAE